MNEEILHDMLKEVEDALVQDETIREIKEQGALKSFNRPEGLEDTAISVVIDPLGPPERVAKGSNTSLSKKFIYQINVESGNRMECKTIQRKIERQLESIGFAQTSGGLDEYFTATKRYVDARRYIGHSKLYENY